MTVYLDTVFVLNFCVNFCLLHGTARLGGSGVKRRWLALGAAVGALYAVAVYLPGMQWLRLTPMKLLSAGAMLLCAFGVKRSTVRLTAVFAAMTLVLCGAVYSMSLLLHGTTGDGLFFPVTVPSLLLTAGAVDLACRLLLPRLTHAPDSILPVTLRLRDRSTRISALRDSGNTLCDPVSGASVLVADWHVARFLLPTPVRAADFAAPAALALRLQEFSPRLIPYRAVGVASGMLIAIPCEITMNHATKHGLVAFSPTPVSDGGAYEALTGGTLC